MVAHQHASMFPIELVEKDFDYASQILQAKPSTIAAVCEVYRDAIARGYGDQNITGVVQFFI